MYSSIRDVSLFSGGGGRATILGERVIIFFPLVWGRVSIQGFLGEDHNFFKVFLLRKG